MNRLLRLDSSFARERNAHGFFNENTAVVSGIPSGGSRRIQHMSGETMITPVLDDLPGSEATKDLLFADLEYFGECEWRNEESGEKRFNFFITLVTAVEG